MGIFTQNQFWTRILDFGVILKQIITHEMFTECLY